MSYQGWELHHWKLRRLKFKEITAKKRHLSGFPWKYIDCSFGAWLKDDSKTILKLGFCVYRNLTQYNFDMNIMNTWLETSMSWQWTTNMNKTQPSDVFLGLSVWGVRGYANPGSVPGSPPSSTVGLEGGPSKSGTSWKFTWKTGPHFWKEALGY